MSLQDGESEVRSKLAHILEGLPPGSCFTRCQLSSFTGIVLRCMIAMPERMVRFMVLTSSVRDDRGNLISAGEPIQFGTKGWVLGEWAGTSDDQPPATIVRIRQAQADSLEVEVDGRDVIRLA